MKILILVCGMLLLWATSAQAVTLIAEDSFEVKNGTTDIGDQHWGWASGYCGYSPLSDPCPFLDLSTDFFHAGTKSLKSTFNLAWSDPNPQINTQAIFKTLATPQDEVYIRYWQRTRGFIYSNPTTKNIYWKTSGTSGQQVPNVISVNFNSRYLSYAAQTWADCPTPYSSCNLYANMAGVPLNDDQWYCIEEHVKLNTPGVADGMVEIWVNGTQVLGYYNRMMRGAAVNGPNGNSSTTKLSSFQIYKQNGGGTLTAAQAGYAPGSPTGGYGLRYHDQFTAATTRIGDCGGAPIDTTAPTTPTSFTVAP